MSFHVEDIEKLVEEPAERDELRFRYRQGKFSRAVRKISRRRSSFAQGGVHQRRSRKFAW